eukprot:m.218227 g.218227  ORF g.218227 m.218227 type:complete len:658 (-) comp18678_c1_seq2:272-2245(-)
MMMRAQLQRVCVDAVGRRQAGDVLSSTRRSQLAQVQAHSQRQGATAAGAPIVGGATAHRRWSSSGAGASADFVPPPLSTQRFTANIPTSIDPDTTPRTLGSLFWRVPEAQPLAQPRVACTNKNVLPLLGLPSDLPEHWEAPFARLFSGSEFPETLHPLACNYAGFQFGVFAGQLGDGRGITLGHLQSSPSGQLIEVHLKGTGTTPFSRTGDGRASLDECMWELVMSENLHALGVPTTQAAAVVVDSDSSSAVVTRVAPSFTRFGTFDLFYPGEGPAHGAAGPCTGDPAFDELLKSFLDLTIDQHFPALDDEPDKYEAFFRSVVHDTARMTASWMAFGFAHGLLNTDNMSILGLTLDHGRSGFMERFSKDFDPNSEDVDRMYSFQNQPSICLRNLFALSQSLATILPTSVSTGILSEFNDVFRDRRQEIMRQKFGVDNMPEDLEHEFWDTMESTAADFSLVFRLLTRAAMGAIGDPEALQQGLVAVSGAPEDRKAAQQPVLPRQDLERLVQMYHENRAQYEQVTGLDSLDPVNDEILKHESQRLLENISKHDWERHLSSVWGDWSIKYVEHVQREALPAELRQQVMQAANPRYIARPHLVKPAAEAAEAGDFGPLRTLLDVLSDPCDLSSPAEACDVGPDVAFSSSFAANERPADMDA